VNGTKPPFGYRAVADSMGSVMGHLITFRSIVGFLVALLVAFVFRDLYACSGYLQRILLRLGALLVPAHEREETYNQWYGDLCALPPSELLRVGYALECIRGGIVIGWRAQIKARLKSFVAERLIGTADHVDGFAHALMAQSISSYLEEQPDIAAKLDEMELNDTMIFTLDTERTTVTLTARKKSCGAHWSKAKIAAKVGKKL
jgi:hypothetical protein